MSSSHDAMRNLRELFEKYDDDNRGSLDSDELALLLKE